jgi:hypothetical protein
MTTFGFRQGSWIDLGGRHSGRQGRYLRWGNINFSLAGYEDEQPVITVEGRLLGSKSAARSGDRQVFTFSAATGQSVASRSFALTLVALAVVSKSMPANFVRALEDQTYGESLLGPLNRPFALWAKDDCKTAPVFVSEKTSLSAAGGKHPSDSAAPGLDKYMPLNTVQTGKTLVTLSKTIGMDGTVGAAVLRRTWSLNAQTRGSFSAHRIAASMEHSRASQSLHQEIYIPTQRPEDTAGFARPELASTSALGQASLARAGAVEQLPRLAEEHRDNLSLSHALGAYLAALSDGSAAAVIRDAADIDGEDDEGDHEDTRLLLFDEEERNHQQHGNGNHQQHCNGNGNH